MNNHALIAYLDPDGVSFDSDDDWMMIDGADFMSVLPSKQFCQLSKKQQHSHQRQWVRQLLGEVVQRCFEGFNFHQHQHPYYISKDNQRYFVSFSHSNNSVALIIAANACAIDIEKNSVNPAIAERFFHHNEKKLINCTPKPMQMPLIKRLWQIKECMAKLNNQPLAHMIGRDFCAMIAPFYQNASSTYRHISTDNLSIIMHSDMVAMVALSD